ncbi:MAG: hypothetical protein COA85_06570 [Robiginitomaculum sp.]|nr:MAG: hypothetical protein COA85_06570 [Robiginitomaculum sp.]
MHKHTIDLLKRLLAATEEERLEWQEVPGKTAFSYLAGDFVVLVDADEEHASFRLTDSKGRTLEQAANASLNVSLGTSGDHSALTAVKRIHAIAKRQAMGTDAAIASVLEHLQNLGEVDGEAEKETAEAPSELPSDEPSLMEELASGVEEESEGEPGHDDARDEQGVAEFEGHGEIEQSENPEASGHVLSEPDLATEVKTEKKRKRSLFNPFGGKR